MQNLYKKKIASLISFFTLKKKLGDRVLTYHSINNKKNSTTSNIYQLEKDLFYNQVKLLIDKKVNFELIDNFQNNKTNYLLTFDDGFKNLKDKILEFLSNHKIPCLLFFIQYILKSIINLLNKTFQIYIYNIVMRTLSNSFTIFYHNYLWRLMKNLKFLSNCT